jgi:hypothetical protein
MKVWTVPISLATTKGILYLVSFPLGTEMFHFPRCPSAAYVFSGSDHRASREGVSPFRDLRIKGCLPPPRSLSQAATSFVGSSLPSHPPYALMCFNHPDVRTSRNQKWSCNYFNYLCIACKCCFYALHVSRLNRYTYLSRVVQKAYPRPPRRRGDTDRNGIQSRMGYRFCPARAKVERTKASLTVVGQARETWRGF